MSCVDAFSGYLLCPAKGPWYKVDIGGGRFVEIDALANLKEMTVGVHIVYPQPGDRFRFKIYNSDTKEFIPISRGMFTPPPVEKPIDAARMPRKICDVLAQIEEHPDFTTRVDQADRFWIERMLREPSLRTRENNRMARSTWQSLYEQK